MTSHRFHPLALVAHALTCTASCTPGGEDPDAGSSPDRKTLTLVMEKDGDGLGDVVSDPEGIDCASDCDAQEHEFVIGGNVALTATPARDAMFGGWSCLLEGGNTRVDTDESIVAVLPEDEEGARIVCTPTFRHLTTIVFIFPGAGEGRVTGTLTKSDGTPRLDCRSDDGVVCDAGYFADEVDTFSATPDDGSTFAGWGFDCGTGTDPATVTMDEDRNCEANFE